MVRERERQRIELLCDLLGKMSVILMVVHGHSNARRKTL